MATRWLSTLRRCSLLDEPGTNLANSASADRSSFLQRIELLDFICGAETNHAPKLITRFLCSLHIALCDASSLKNQICQDGNV